MNAEEKAEMERLLRCAELWRGAGADYWLREAVRLGAEQAQELR